MSKAAYSMSRILPVTQWERVTWFQRAVTEAQRRVDDHPGEEVYRLALESRRAELAAAQFVATRTTPVGRRRG